MIKADIINQIVIQTGIKKSEAKATVEILLDTIQQTLSKGEKIKIRGFGTFHVRNRAERMGKNLRMGNDRSKVKNAWIPARKIPAFRPSKEMAGAVKANVKVE